MYIHLTSLQRTQLVLAAKQDLESLDKTISDIRRDNPKAFQTRQSLAERVFYIKPAQAIPCSSWHAEPQAAEETAPM
jgi:multidrug efflux pump subunit AcrA (membrane-fusion protein)